MRKVASKKNQKISNNLDIDFTDRFVDRHIGVNKEDESLMLRQVGLNSLEALVDSVVPAAIRTRKSLDLPEAVSETEALKELREMMDENQIYRSFIGMGYHDTITPPVIQRNILENPGWYTQYTPYQAEISQGRLEALVNFQTMICDLTGLEMANASLLDEATAAAEAMTFCLAAKNEKDDLNFFISAQCHPQTIAVVSTRAKALGIELIVGDHNEFDFKIPVFGVLLQYPSTDGSIYNYETFIEKAHANGALVAVSADLMSLTLLKPPGEFGADIAVGSTQRFGVPLGYGGPHAAYFSTKTQYQRLIPGRIVGVSKDSSGQPAYRLALQTREQHIRRDRATSNICTSQVLLAIMSSMYAVYHGPEGLKKIASRIHKMTQVLASGLEALGFDLKTTDFFDTVAVKIDSKGLEQIRKNALHESVNLRYMSKDLISVTLDETTDEADIQTLLRIFSGKKDLTLEGLKVKDYTLPKFLIRDSSFLQHPVFSSYQTETEMLRYLNRLQKKDLSLTTSMIPLGSCTMKLNATSEMFPVSWPSVSKLHPFAPNNQTRGYQKLVQQLEYMLGEITGLPSVSLQPNAGSQGEYAGLLVIRKFHESKKEGHRHICLIPTSAHGTNPASAVMAGMKVVPVACDRAGNIDLEDLKQKAQTHSKNLSALMVTYPSTHGVFEQKIKEICQTVHDHGGLVYLDGANMNAQVGLCRPGEYGADVCHLNLHKTFCIPHGGGGPGMGPICATEKLAPFLPSHPFIQSSDQRAVGAISAAPWGSPSILPISWMYIRMMGPDGLKRATEIAILSANYLAMKLDPHFPVLYRGKDGFVAHECILDFRKIKSATGVEVEDVAKRLMDYGYHAPTVSFPVIGTVMVEPTESESKAELDRFCEAMISIRSEMKRIEDGRSDKKDNPLKNAPHTALTVSADEWNRSYSRAEAAFPVARLKNDKYWPPVGRIDNPWGDRNLFCTCPPISESDN